MKKTHLKSTNFNYLQKSFAEWLDVMGYAGATIKSYPFYVRELFHYLEQKHIDHITQIKPRHVSDFLKYLQQRSNLKYGGGLSTSTINGCITALNLFAHYVNQTGKHILDIHPRRLENQSDERTILTGAEIKALYEASFEPHPTFNSLAMGQRDRAIIGIFYGCGLRKTEGSKLNISDIDLLKRVVFVKHGKGAKQRYVPIATRHYEDIRAYLEEGRYWFLQDNRTAWHVKKGVQKEYTDDEAFFLNGKGQRMQSFYQRLDYLKEKAGIEKSFSTHNLRHSIATHLLQSGMPIEEIAKFLGHSSLESTQIYTHIVSHLNTQGE